MVTDEELLEAREHYLDAQHLASLLGKVHDGLVAQAMLERDVPAGHYVDSATGQIKRERQGA